MRCENGENGYEKGISWPCTHDSCSCGYEMGMVEMKARKMKVSPCTWEMELNG